MAPKCERDWPMPAVSKLEICTTQIIFYFYCTTTVHCSTSNTCASAGGAKQTFSPLEIGTKNQKFIINLKSAA